MSSSSSPLSKRHCASHSDGLLVRSSSEFGAPEPILAFPHVVRFCEEQDLWTFRVLNKSLKGVADQELVSRALTSLPLLCNANISGPQRSKGEARLQVSNDWTDEDHSSRSALIELALKEAVEADQSDERLQLTRQILQRNDRIFWDHLVEEEESGSSSGDSSIGDRCAMPYGDCRPPRHGGWGATITFNESLKISTALDLVVKMTSSMQYPVLNLGNHNYDHLRGTDIRLIKQRLFYLLVAAEAHSIRHGYEAHWMKDPGDAFYQGGNSGALQFLTAANQRIEINFSSIFDLHQASY